MKTTSAKKAIIVVGAGPKALAIAAKHSVLRKLRWTLPPLIIIEKDSVAAHWSGKSGFTDGWQSLGTPPQKDIGFPYASTCWGKYNACVNQAMSAFSWQNFLIAKGKYGRWIDCGRPSPTHREWSEYLRWVANEVNPNMIIGEVLRFGLNKSRWEKETV
jgi:mycobactin lysine-N-oxygenase